MRMDKWTLPASGEGSRDTGVRYTGALAFGILYTRDEAETAASSHYNGEIGAAPGALPNAQPTKTADEHARCVRSEFRVRVVCWSGACLGLGCTKQIRKIRR